MQQEVRLLAEYSGDTHMIESYREDKDIYASVASIVFKTKYEENKEFWPDGSANPEGKKRRAFCKSIVLGLMYQRGASSIAEQINQPVEKAQEIIDDFYKNFPKVKDYVESSISFAKKHGYVEDFWGRRRHLPDILLPKYSITQANNCDTNFNPLLGCSGDYNKSNNPLIKKYADSLSNIKYSKEYTALKAAAAAEGIVIEDNGGKIAQAERQCVNARIQGGAATLTKIAMIKVHNDPELKKLKFTLLLAVHDELIGECPAEVAEQVADRLTYIMRTAAQDKLSINFKCDPTIEEKWYLSDYVDNIVNHYHEDINNGLSKEESLNKLIAEHTEQTSEFITQLIHDKVKS